MEINMPDLIVRGFLTDYYRESWVAFFKNNRVFEISDHEIKEDEFEYDPLIYSEVPFEEVKDFIIGIFGSLEKFFEEVGEVCS